MNLIRPAAHREHTRFAGGNPARRGFTLLEVMVALTITLILMGLIVEIFSKIGKGVNNSRANMELNDQLRQAKHRLIQDLRGITSPMTPPLDPNMNLGYFEYVEGPRCASTQTYDGSSGGEYGLDIGAQSGVRMVNSVIGDTDDCLMFTTSNYDGEQFVGKGGARNGLSMAIRSRHAEVAWFLRGITGLTSLRNDANFEFFNLHRRQWLVLPEGSPFGGNSYAEVDISMRATGGNFEPMQTPPNMTIDPKTGKLPPGVANNTLSDLTRREYRSYHQPARWPNTMYYMPFVNGKGHVIVNNAGMAPWNRYNYLSLPTLNESTHSIFPSPQMEKTSGTGVNMTFVPKASIAEGAALPGFAFPNNVATKDDSPATAVGSRMGEDLVLTNVVSFDVKAWDPGAPVFAAPMADASVAAGNSVAAVLVPGDAGYIAALDAFIANTSGTAVTAPLGFGAYADLNYMGTDTTALRASDRWKKYAVGSSCSVRALESGAPYGDRCKLPRPAFAHPGEGALAGYPIKAIAISGTTTTVFYAPRPCVYDTWSTHYEFDGQDNDGDNVIDEFTNGIDDNGNGLIDEPNIYNNDALGTESGEQDAPPPYRSPLRGIKVSIRVMEQESKQVREVTVVQEFIPL